VTLLAVCQLAFGARTHVLPNAEWQPRITAVAAHTMDRWQPLIAEAAQRFGLPQSWIRTVMKAESGGRTTRDGVPITSPAGAMGLMQVMPQTYLSMQLHLGLGPDPYAPRDNVLAGTAYLADMYQRYGYPGLFAAYNAGPERFERYLEDGTPLPSETVRYLARIGSDALAMQAPSASEGAQVANTDTSERADFTSRRAVFFVNRKGHAHSSGPPNDSLRAGAHHGPSGTLFVVRNGAGTHSESQSAGRLFVPLARNHF